MYGQFIRYYIYISTVVDANDGVLFVLIDYAMVYLYVIISSFATVVD